MVSFKIEVRKKDFVWIVPLVAVLVVGVVYAYGTFDPVVMGHSAGELDFSSGVNGDAIFNNNVEVGGSITLGGVSESSWPSGGLTGSQTICSWSIWTSCTASGTSTSIICPVGTFAAGYQRRGCSSVCADPTRCEQARIYCCN